MGRIGDVAVEVGGVEAPGIESVDDDAGAVGTIDRVHALGHQRRNDETGRDENEFALTGHGGETAQSFFHMTVGKLGRGVPGA